MTPSGFQVHHGADDLQGEVERGPSAPPPPIALSLAKGCWIEPGSSRFDSPRWCRGATYLSIVLLLCGGCGGGSDSGGVAVRVVGPEGNERLSVTATIAADESSRRRGLAGVASLPRDSALLIVVPRETEVCITNAGVVFAIDVIFAGADGTVIAVEREIPAGATALRCHASVQQVLETNAGVAAAVVAGDRMLVD